MADHAADRLVRAVGAQASMGLHYYPIMILYSVALHIVWALCGLHDPHAYNATALSSLFRLFGNFTPLVLISVALSAFVGTEIRKFMVSFALLLPQQTVLVISAVSSIHAMVVGHFADGVERPVAFIISDQIPAVLAALGHTAAVVQFVLRETHRW